MTKRAAALGLTRGAAALEDIADLSARTCAAVERAAAAIRPDAAAARCRGAGPPLAAAAAAALDVTDLPGWAATAVLGHTTGICHGAALDLGFFA